MSEMVERVADAIAEVPIPWVRDNRWGGKGYEVGYVDGDVISDETMRILGAFPTGGEASAFQAKWVKHARARAAIEALWEPTDKMKATEGVHWGYGCHVCGGLTQGWQAMLAAALSEPKED